MSFESSSDILHVQCPGGLIVHVALECTLAEDGMLLNNDFFNSERLYESPHHVHTRVWISALQSGSLIIVMLQLLELPHNWLLYIYNELFETISYCTETVRNFHPRN